MIPLQAGVAQRVGRGIALLFHDHGTRRGWVVSSTPRPHLTPGKDPVPILKEVEGVSWPVWTGGKSRPHRDSIPDRPARSQSLYRLSYPVNVMFCTLTKYQNLFLCFCLCVSRTSATCWLLPGMEGEGGCTPRVPSTQITFLKTNNLHADLQRDCNLLHTDRQCVTLLRHQL